MHTFPAQLTFQKTIIENEKGIKLKKLVDSTIQKMREDGSLTKISIKWFGADITKSPN